MSQGHRYIDSDAHVLEPRDMWERYLDPAFRDEMPRTTVGYAGDPYGYVLECWVHGVGMPSYLIGTPAPLPGLKEALRWSRRSGTTTKRAGCPLSIQRLAMAAAR